MFRTVLLVVAATAGCGGRAGDPARFIPSPQAAKTALTSGLEAWKKGLPTGAIKGESPSLHIVDEGRPIGQRLRSFEILGEIPSDGARVFNVLLETDGPPAKETARYVVVGVDPIWVFRQQDYDKMAHWEMDMKHDDDPPEKTASSPPDRRP